MESRKSRSGLIAAAVTLIVHGLFIGLLCVLTLTTERASQPKEEFVLIDIGDLPSAQGQDEVLGQAAELSQQATSSAESSLAKPKTDPKNIRSSAPVQQSPSKVAKPRASQELMTQSHEESLRKRQAEEEVRIKAEAERKERMLAEAKAQADAAERARIERAALEQEAKKRQAGASVANAFGAGRRAGSSQGNAAGSGNQGDPNGVAGGSFSLEGRRIISNGGRLSTPRTNRAIEGRIVVNIVVDSRGVITSAVISPRGTTIADATVRAEALRAAQKTSFDAQEGAESQKGTITYIYIIKD